MARTTVEQDGCAKCAPTTPEIATIDDSHLLTTPSDTAHYRSHSQHPPTLFPAPRLGRGGVRHTVWQEREPHCVAFVLVEAAQQHYQFIPVVIIGHASSPADKGTSGDSGDCVADAARPSGERVL